MSIEIMENDDPDEADVGRNSSPNGDRIKQHSYSLRAKTPRFMGFQVSEHEDGEFKKPSSSPSFYKPLSSPIHSRGSKSAEHCDHEYTLPSEEEDLANCLVMLSSKSCSFLSDHKDESKDKEVVLEKGMFQCKACKKVFNSHQALGGHRASHKKVKGCFASKIDGLNDEENVGDEDLIQEDKEAPIPLELDTNLMTTRKRAKMHECTVCRRVFSSGQALGGHKRCHWVTSSSDNAFMPHFHELQYDHQSQQLCKQPMFMTNTHDQDQDIFDHDHGHQLDLNLNLPPTPNLQQWSNHKQQKIDCDTIDNKVEKGCGMKLRKLSDLRDVNMDGGWLQMGIASTTEMR